MYAQHGKLGGYQIKDAQSKISLSLTENQLSALFLTLNESQSYSTLPYQTEIQAIIKQCLGLPQTRLRKLLKRWIIILNLKIVIITHYHNYFRIY